MDELREWIANEERTTSEPGAGGILSVGQWEGRIRYPPPLPALILTFIYIVPPLVSPPRNPRLLPHALHHRTSLLRHRARRALPPPAYPRGPSPAHPRRRRVPVLAGGKVWKDPCADFAPVEHRARVCPDCKDGECREVAWEYGRVGVGVGGEWGGGVTDGRVCARVVGSSVQWGWGYVGGLSGGFGQGVADFIANDGRKPGGA